MLVNIGWAVGCIALLTTRAVELNALGAGFVVLHALTVLLLENFEFVGLKGSLAIAENARAPLTGCSKPMREAQRRRWRLPHAMTCKVIDRMTALRDDAFAPDRPRISLQSAHRTLVRDRKPVRPVSQPEPSMPHANGEAIAHRQPALVQTPPWQQQQSVGALLRNWRSRRRSSQLDLALAADVSARHLHFVENGRARASAPTGCSRSPSGSTCRCANVTSCCSRLAMRRASPRHRSMRPI